MKLPIYIADAFTTKPFAGNPAAVCLLSQEISEQDMQNIASEMNLSETAYLTPSGGYQESNFRTGSRFKIRWFSPTTEVPLCGHATLASAAVLFRKCHNISNTLHFETLKSGTLTVAKVSSEANKLLMNMQLPVNPPDLIIPRDDPSIQEIVRIVLGSAEDVEDLRLSTTTKKLLVRVNFGSRKKLENLAVPPKDALLRVDSGDRVRGVMVTGMDPDGKYDFISRYFSPWNGIPEDPVTGSAHTVLAPYWMDQLSKKRMSARQCSPRGGNMDIEMIDELKAIKIIASAVVVTDGFIEI